MNQCRWYSVCPMRQFEARGQLSVERTDPWCRGDWSSCARYKAFMAGRHHPDNLLPGGTIDENLS